MNEYAKEGKRFLHTVNEYFEEYGRAVGGLSSLFSRYMSASPSLMPDTNKLIADMSHIRYPKHSTLPLKKCGKPGFDGYFVIGDENGKIEDFDLEVFNSKMGAWQLILLLVLAKHIMPLYQHANYMKWQPIFDDRALRNLRESNEKYSDDYFDTYSFIPKNMPTEPEVEAYGDSSGYRVKFYVWTDFGGYMAVVTDLTFPDGKQYVKVCDVKLHTEIETLYKYQCDILF